MMPFAQEHPNAVSKQEIYKIDQMCLHVKWVFFAKRLALPKF